MSDVKIYTANYCPYCTRVKQFFSDKNIAFEEIDITNDTEARAALTEKTKVRTVPQVFINDEFVGGCDDILALDAKGELDSYLQ